MTPILMDTLTDFLFVAFRLVASNLVSSEEKQEADQDETARRLIRARQQQPARPHHPQEHASARAHHAVRAQGHRTGDHLLGLRQHAARHLLTTHDHSEQARRAAGHLCSQVGQVTAR